jgi:hypothetical protein
LHDTWCLMDCSRHHLHDTSFMNPFPRVESSLGTKRLVRLDGFAGRPFQV